MSVDSSPDLDKILYQSMSVDSSPDFDKISTCDPIFRKNGYVKSQWEKIFEFEIFVLKSKMLIGGGDQLPVLKQVSVMLPIFEKKWAKNAIKSDFLGVFGVQISKNFLKIGHFCENFSKMSKLRK